MNNLLAVMLQMIRSEFEKGYVRGSVLYYCRYYLLNIKCGHLQT